MMRSIPMFNKCVMYNTVLQRVQIYIYTDKYTSVDAVHTMELRITRVYMHCVVLTVVSNEMLCTRVVNAHIATMKYIAVTPVLGNFSAKEIRRKRLCLGPGPMAIHTKLRVATTVMRSAI